MSSLQFLPFVPSMIHEAADLFIDTFSREPWNDVYESEGQVLQFFENYLQDNYFRGYVLKKEDRLIALCIGAKKPWLKGMEYYIDQFCVSADFQRQGIGQTFLELIEKDILDQGMTGMILMTERSFPAETFYLKNGFEELKEIVFLAK